MPERLRQLRALAAQEPDDPLTRFLLGREEAEAGHWAEARAAFARAIELDPAYSAAYRQLGNAWERLGERERAAEVYREGIPLAEGAGDLQAAKEMRAFLKRLERGSRD